jgi:hypothetical protein
MKLVHVDAKKVKNVHAKKNALVDVDVKKDKNVHVVMNVIVVMIAAVMKKNMSVNANIIVAVNKQILMICFFML